MQVPRIEDQGAGIRLGNGSGIETGVYHPRPGHVNGGA